MKPPLSRGKGEQILELLVNAESDGLYSGSTWTGTLARWLEWARDGRSVRPAISRLASAALVEEDRSRPVTTGSYWLPTERGREVDTILREITACRGGAFRGRGEAGIDSSESHALR